MIRLLKELKTAHEVSVGMGAKIIPFVNTLDEIYCFKYILQVYPENVENYLECPPVPSVLDDSNRRLTGKNWQYLSSNEVKEIESKVSVSLSDMENGMMRYGWLARYVYKHIVADIRQRIGYWSIYEERFERYYENLSEIAVDVDYIVDKVSLSNIEGDTDIDYRVAVGAFSSEGVLLAGDSIELDVDLLSTGDTLTISEGVKSKVLVKYYDREYIDDVADFGTI